MTREDYIRLAQEAHRELLASGKGMHVWHEDAYVGDVQAFCERFAALVAAAEREACAKLCEEKETYGDPVQCWLDDCAASIRARGET
jgi:hypothetical protein